METKKRRWPTVVLIIFILVVAALYVYLYLMPEITGSLTPTYVVQYGQVLKTEEVHAIVVRDEEAVKAEHHGTIGYYSKETEKTRQGFTVADIYSGGNKYSLNCKSTGFVSYYTDGYEEIFNPSTLGTLDLEAYWDFAVVPENSVRNEAAVGETVYKLIKSNTWYFLLMVPGDRIEHFPLNSSVSIILEDGSEVPGTVSRLLGDGDKRGVVVSTKRFNQSFAQLRAVDVTVVTENTSGLIVPKTAVATQTKTNDAGEAVEVKGVYVHGVDEEYTFREIEILTEDNDNVIAAEGKGLRLYDEILRNADAQ